MKLSEAIRLGAMMSEQAFDDETEGKRCALQAAQDAVALQPLGMDHKSETYYAALSEQWPILDELFENPAGGDMEELTSCIFNLNDTHEWSRERIAAWVATIEPQDEPTAAKEPACANALTVNQ